MKWLRIISPLWITWTTRPTKIRVGGMVLTNYQRRELESVSWQVNVIALCAWTLIVFQIFFN